MSQGFHTLTSLWNKHSTNQLGNKSFHTPRSDNLSNVSELLRGPKVSCSLLSVAYDNTKQSVRSQYFPTCRNDKRPVNSKRVEAGESKALVLPISLHSKAASEYKRYSCSLLYQKSFFLLQWMATGRSGENGGNVPELVAADSTHALELVPILLLGTAGKIALGNPKKPVPVTPIPVQVLKTKLLKKCLNLEQRVDCRCEAGV